MKYRRTLALTEDGDLRVENGGFVWLEGIAAVEQELKTTLLTIRGEDPFDEDHGLDLHEVAGAPPEVVDRDIRRTLNEDDRVDTIDAVEIADPGADRRTEVEVDLTLVDGTGLNFSMAV